MRITTAAVIALLLLAGSAGGAAADEPGESEESSQLVRQAIALIVNTPGDMEGIEDKIVDAQEAPDQDGVDLEWVRQAQESFDAGDMHEARARLERSIGAEPHTGRREPLPIGETGGVPGMAAGAETGIDVVGDPLEADRSRSSGDWIALAVLVLLGAGGVVLGVRHRPRHGSTAEVGA